MTNKNVYEPLNQTHKSCFNRWDFQLVPCNLFWELLKLSNNDYFWIRNQKVQNYSWYSAKFGTLAYMTESPPVHHDYLLEIGEKINELTDCDTAVDKQNECDIQLWEFNIVLIERWLTTASLWSYIRKFVNQSQWQYQVDWLKLKPLKRVFDFKSH